MIFDMLRELSLRSIYTAAVLAAMTLIFTTVPAMAQQVDVDSLVNELTLDEKLSLLHGAQDPTGAAGAGYLPGVPRLGIPPLRLADGPAGIRTNLPATALPAPVALSASFDPDLARRFGQVIGREGRARNQDVLLSPMVNIVRVPLAGRNFETFGEDPLLAGRMVAEEIRGIEGEGLIATVKHYAANNFEHERMSVSADIDERTLQEIYLPGFEAAVDAGVGAAMCAYNKVNGTYACENENLLTDVLRDQFGFEGWVMTDWFARHSLDALAAGLDQEMPGYTLPGPFAQPVYFADPLRKAVEAGEIDEALVDRAVGRILGQMNRMGLLGGDVPPRPDMDEEAGAAVARDVALAGAVLLRNENDVLPLHDDDLASLVVIGPTAQQLLYGGGGSSHVTPFDLGSPVEALRRAAGDDADIRYLPGIDLDGVAVPASALAAPDDEQGLQRTGTGGATQRDVNIDFTGDGALPAGSRWQWKGTLTAPETGEYDLKLQTEGGMATLTFDGEEVLSTTPFLGNASLLPTAEGLANASMKVRLEAGEPHDVTVAVQGGSGFFDTGTPPPPLQVRLAWVTPERRQAFRDEAAQAARAARTVIVFGYDEGTEFRDRTSLSLPGTQDALIAAVAEANPRAVVVLNTGDPVLMPWLDDAQAVLQMWYPGQEGAEATAALLTGAATPGGKLPVTFPPSDEQAPTAAPERYPGVEGRAAYDESILVGYRWYDAQDVEPLFAFGHGLSYTTFAYEDLDVAEAEDGFDVTFRVRNTGDVAGAEVPQVYLGPPAEAPVPMAPQQLVGFERVELEPGEEETVTIHVGPRQLSYWSTDQDDWVVAAGQRALSVGASSRDVRLEGEITVPDDQP